MLPQKVSIMNRLLHFLEKLRLWQLFLLATGSSILFSEIIVIPLSFIFHGRLTSDYPVTGLITALIVSFLISYLLVALIEQSRASELALSESEKRYRSLFENMLEGFAYCKMLYKGGRPIDFLYLEVNSAFEKLTGLTNVVGKKVSEILPGINDSHPELIEIYGRVASTGKTERFEIYLEPLSAWLSISVYGSTEGYFVAVFDNITERKKAEAAILDSETKYRTIFDQARDIIFTLAPDLTIASVNRAFETISGWSREEWLGKPFASIVYPDDLSKANEIFQMLLQGKRSEMFELKLLKKSGEYLIGEFTAASIPQGNTATVVGVLRDVTERERMENELKKLNEELEKKVTQRTAELAVKNEELEELAQTRAEFIATASHDLRAPLTGVLGFTELLLKGKAEPLGERQEKYLKTIYKSGKDLLNVVEDLLDISRIDTGRLQLMKREFNIAGGISRSLTPLEPLFAAKKLQLEIEIDENLPTVNADPNRFNQMLTNYLSNALKFTPEGGKVTIRVQKDVDYVRTSVIDTGIGISQDDQKQLFEKFFRPEATKYAVPGTGLGLSIVKQLAELQGGAVGMQSELKKGSVFWFTLPVYNKV